MSKAEYYNTRPGQSLAVIQQEMPTSLTRADAKAYVQAQFIALENDLTAALAKQTLDNTAMLAAHAFHCKCEAPEGAEEYQEIIREYAKVAISMWGGGE